MIRGVVLSGGESKRMGSDKGLLTIGPCTWAQLAARKLERLYIPVLISINETQIATYHGLFPSELLVIDQVETKGPLTGLLSAHLKHPDDDLLLLACDMIDMDISSLRFLRDSIATFPGFDYYVYCREDFMEPLCAVYTSSQLKKIHRELKKGSLSNFSLHKLIKQARYKTLTISNIKNFNNHNTQPSKSLI
jgi:molybdopterin-guanine dinucleotide biosynthesis protein A